MNYKIIDNFSITHLFLEKKVTINVIESETSADIGKFSLVLPTVRDLLSDEQCGSFFYFLTADNHKLYEMITFTGRNSLGFFTTLICAFGPFDAFRVIADNFRKVLQNFIPELTIDFKNKSFKIGSLIITEEIWDYIIYIVKLSRGEKTNKPITDFINEEAKQFYLAQLANDEKIRRLREKSSQHDEDQLIKVLLAITYSFPSLTIDYLFNQTLAQIYWLQKYAAGAVSYDVNAQAFAAGNVKKGSKLDFFIK